jgi:predicted Zn-ribbon and HTH transcriptional regulator
MRENKMKHDFEDLGSVQWVEKPGHCPKCKSPYWNKPRKIKKEGK